MAFGFPDAIFLHIGAFTFFPVFVKLYLLRVWIGGSSWSCTLAGKVTVPYPRCL